MKLIKSSTYKQMPWKNGQGLTSEIEIFPADVNFAENDFIWRLSLATIRSSSSFSVFPGFDRLLAIWKGDGLILNGKEHGKLTPFEFSGEIPIDCMPQGEEVRDVGLIFRRDKVKASMKLKIFPGNPRPHKMRLEEGIHFLVCVNGEFSVGELEVKSEDTLKVDEAESILVLASAGATCLHIQLQT